MLNTDRWITTIEVKDPVNKAQGEGASVSETIKVNADYRKESTSDYFTSYHFTLYISNFSEKQRHHAETIYCFSQADLQPRANLYPAFASDL